MPNALHLVYLLPEISESIVFLHFCLIENFSSKISFEDSYFSLPIYRFLFINEEYIQIASKLFFFSQKVQLGGKLFKLIAVWTS